MTSFRIDQAALNEVLAGQSGPVVVYANDIGRQINNAAKMEAPVDTGNLRARHEYTVTTGQGYVDVLVGSTADYGLDVHEGHMTRPATVSVGRGRRVSVQRKIPGNPWLQRALARFGLVLQRNR